MGVMKLLYTIRNEGGVPPTRAPSNPRLAQYVADLVAFCREGCPGRAEGESFCPALVRWRAELGRARRA
ncbi:hypothetical protein ACFL09_05920 [Planctomycetota bacterium]